MVEAHRPEARIASFLQCGRKVDGLSDGKVQGGTCRRTHNRSRDLRASTRRDHDPDTAGSLGSTDDRTEVLRVLDAVEKHEQSRIHRDQIIEVRIAEPNLGGDALGPGAAQAVALRVANGRDRHTSDAGSVPDLVRSPTGEIRFDEDALDPLAVRKRGLHRVRTADDEIGGAAGAPAPPFRRATLHPRPLAADSLRSSIRAFMGTTLRRYLVWEILVSAIAGLGVFSFILLIARLLELVDLVMARGVPAAAVLRLLGYIVPSFLEIAIPVSLLLGVIVGLGRLASDGEMLAIRAAGVSLWQIVRPVAIVGCLGCGSVLLVSGWLRPWSLGRIETTLYEIASTRAAAALRPAMFNTVGEGLVLYAQRIEQRENRLHGILLSDERSLDAHTTVLAESAELKSDAAARDVFLRLNDGTSVTFRPNVGNHDTTVFGSLEVHVSLGAPAARGTSAGSSSVGRLYPHELYADARAVGADKERALEAALELHRRAAFTVGTLLLALLGVPLGSRPASSTRGRGLTVSVVVAIAYELTMTVSVTLARRQIVSAAAAMWLPDVLLALGAAMLLVRAAGEPSSARLLRALGLRQRALG